MSAPLLLPLPATLDPMRLRALAAAQPHGFVLDSGDAIDGWQFLGFAPRWTLETRGPVSQLERDGVVMKLEAPALEALQEALDAWQMPTVPGAPPFWGGAVGFLSYDLGRMIERLPCLAVDDLGLPEQWWGFYDAVVAISAQGETTLCLSPAPGESDEDLEAKRQLWEQRLAAPAPAPEVPMRAAGPAIANFTHDAYLASVRRVLDHIGAGDLYQVNLSQRFAVPVDGDAFSWFEQLRRLNPAPFAAYLALGETTVVSASPERFLRRVGDVVETSPIKGTRPRGKTPVEDQALAHALAASVKDRAEHLMIVDLERNDLGRVSRPGSVRVTERFVLEAHPTVWHMVSTVEGDLREGIDTAELLRATFPGGSITGAPKIRSMQVIESLEPTRRGVYTGAIGYLGRDGALDLNIAIRTAVIRGDRLYLQVGGGIVADSDPEAEYQETLDKAAAFFRSLGVKMPCASC